MVSHKHPGGWLFKEEPEQYRFEDLIRDGETVWDGVNNNLALKNLRAVQPGDAVLFYSTGKIKAVIGEMRVTAVSLDDPKRPVITVQPVRRWPRPVTLAEVKSDSDLAGWDLVRNSRLSVMRVDPKQWQRLAAMSQAAPST